MNDDPAVSKFLEKVAGSIRLAEQSEAISRKVAEEAGNVAAALRRAGYAIAETTPARSRSESKAENMPVDLTREEVDAKLATVRADTLAAGAELRADFAELRGEVRTGFESLRSEMHKTNADTLKWVVGLQIAIVSAAVAVLTFVVNNAQRKDAPSPTPIVITLPASAAPAVAPPAAATAPPATTPAK